jgi:two-component system sensor histidine kinase HydH
VENALEAMPEGGVLGVQLLREDPHVRVKIDDTGVGIAEEDLPHIFNPFFSTKTKSTGVGLAKVYTIVEEHAGQIDVRSRIDEGTTFTVSLPMDRRQTVRRDEHI